MFTAKLTPEEEANSKETIKILRQADETDLTLKVDAALTEAVKQKEFDTESGFYAIPGMSGKKYRYFINRLIGSLSDARYLEVGSWAGSTLCSAINGNRVRAVAIDNWSQYGGPRRAFLENLEAFTTPEADVTFIESDFRDVDYGKLASKFNVYLYDGPHMRTDQYDGLAMAMPALDDQFVFIVDDWNWHAVRGGTLEAIDKCGLSILYAASIRTTADGLHADHNSGKESNWHNGYFITVLLKGKTVGA